MYYIIFIIIIMLMILFMIIMCVHVCTCMYVCMYIMYFPRGSFCVINVCPSNYSEYIPLVGTSMTTLFLALCMPKATPSLVVSIL